MTNDLSPAGVEAAARAVMEADCCGYTVDGKQVLCDDPVVGDAQDGYGKPLLRRSCQCREYANAAVTAYAASLPQPEGETAELVERLRAGAWGCLAS